MLPEVITGLSLLLLFVAMQQRLARRTQRGDGDAGTRLGLGRLRGGGGSWPNAGRSGEAAMDLYASPWRALTLITLPLMAPH